MLNPTAPSDILYVHCYIPLKYSFKWIKIVKEIPSEELQVFGPQQPVVPQRPRPRPTTLPTPTSPPHHHEEDDDSHDHDHSSDHHHHHEHETAEHDDENESSSSKAVELDNNDINENILSERKGEVEPTVEDADPTVASTSAGAFSNYRFTSANWHIILSIGVTAAFSLVSL